MTNIEFIKKEIESCHRNLKGQELSAFIRKIGSDAMKRSRKAAAESEGFGTLIEEWPEVLR